MSEGLTAVYRFETKVSTTDASQPGGRLAYAGLSGGFGTITLGQIWNAAYNHVGAITDGSWFYGNSHTGYRHGNAVSYATSAGPVSVQLDAILDGEMNTDSAVDKVEFGMTVDLGDIGKVALAHTNQKDMMSSMMVDVRGSTVADENAIDLAIDDGKVSKTSKVVWRNEDTGDIVKDAKVSNVMHTTGSGDAALSVMAAVVYAGDTAPDSGAVTMDDDGNYRTSGCADDAALNTCTAYAVWVSTTPGANVADTKGEDTDQSSNDEFAVVAGSAVMHTAEAEVSKTTRGSKSNHIAVQLSLGPVTGYLGHSTKKMNGSGDKDKISHYGLSGGLGDSGFSFLAMGRKVEKANGMETSPWLVGVTKGLGGGATAMIEHGNDDDGNSGKTRIGLKVDF